MLRYDFVDISAARIDPQTGWIRDRPVLARTGILEYRRADGSIRREYRPPEEVFHPDSLASLHGVPVTNDHPGVVSAENPVGIIGSSLSAGIQQDSNVVADLIIHHPKAMGLKRELSLGYQVRLDETPGEINGERYDAIQRDIRINHIAVVHRGRAGNARLRLDHEDAASEPVEKDNSMSENKLVSVRLDGLEYQAAPEVARAVERTTQALTAAQADLSSATMRADAAEAARDSLQAKVDAAEASKDQIRADAVKEVKQRLELEAKAVGLGVEVRADHSDRALREAMIAKVRGDSIDLAGKSDAYVDAAFDLAMVDAARGARNTASQRIAVNGGSAARADAAPAGTPYEQMLDRMKSAWKGAA